MLIHFTPSDLLIFTGLAVTVGAFWLMFNRSPQARPPIGGTQAGAGFDEAKA